MSAIAGASALCSPSTGSLIPDSAAEPAASSTRASHATASRVPSSRPAAARALHLFAAVRPPSGARFALVLPEVSTEAMDLFLAEFSKRLAADEAGTN